MPAVATRKRKLKPKTKAVLDPLIVDSFAGGGGASLGIEMAIGRSPHIAINHDMAAIKMHTANHPDTFHYTDDVWHVEPKKACMGRPVKFLWASPDCRHFSRAKGNKPVKKNIRGLAWVVVKWAEEVMPECIFLENVREFLDWGPLRKLMVKGKPKLGKDGKQCYVPIPERKGETFKKWENSLKRLGYKVEWRVLCAADYGVPTTRKRLFVIARRDGKPIVWPEPTHVKPDKNNQVPPGMLPWRAAAECIDWKLECVSIFDPVARKAAGLKPVLAEKTLRRIAMGISRYVIENPRPFIVRCDHGGTHFRGQDIEHPLSTITGHHGFGVVCPSLVSNYGEREGQAPRSQDINEPLDTVVGVPKHSLVAAFLAKHYTGVVGTSMDSPLGTVTAIDHHSYVSASITKIKGNSPGVALTDPMPTITSGAGAERPAGAPHSLSMQAVSLVRIGQTGGNGYYVNEPTEPLTTITSKAEHCLTTANLVQFNHGDKQWKGMHEPLGVVTSQGNKFGLVYSFMCKYYGTAIGADVSEPLHTITSKPRFGVVEIEVERSGKQVKEPAVAVEVAGIGLCVITDIGLRMLQPRELARAQGFPDHYLLTGAKHNQVAKIGNSVPPPLVARIVEANIGKRRPSKKAG